MYDIRLGRELTNEDLPYGLTADEVEAVLKENNFRFYALGRLVDDNDTVQWIDDADYFRAATQNVPSSGINVSFGDIKAIVDKTRNMPNVNDPDVKEVIEKAAKAACEVLAGTFPTINEKFEAEIEALLKLM